MLSLAATAAEAFGSVALSSAVVSGGGSRVRSEMGLQVVLIPAAVCPSFAIRLGDALSSYGKQNPWLTIAGTATTSTSSHHNCDLLTWVSGCLCASGQEPGCRQHVPLQAHRATSPQSHPPGSRSHHHPSFSSLLPSVVHLGCAACVIIC